MSWVSGIIAAIPRLSRTARTRDAPTVDAAQPAGRASASSSSERSCGSSRVGGSGAVMTTFRLRARIAGLPHPIRAHRAQARAATAWGRRNLRHDLVWGVRGAG